MKPRTSLTLGILTLATVALVTPRAAAQTSMVGQAHDFSTNGWSQGEICKPCHTPHHALNDETGAAVGWLWNHQLTTATYTMYDNTTSSSIDAFDTLSRLCMSCHDGTVALDSFGGSPGSSFIGGGELIGVDLTDDHPVGLTAVYPEAGDSHFNAAVNHKLGPNGELKLRPMDIGGVQTYTVGCMTCHTPHYKGFDHQMRMTNSSSAMCLSCHIK